MKAKEIFLRIQPLDEPTREAEIERDCAQDPALRSLVLMLLKGDAATLGMVGLDGLATGARAAIDAALGEAPGAVIGPYTLGRLIGEGGFGSVFLANQLRPVKRSVALKILKAGMDTRQVIARFEQERQALAMMDHPCIAKVFDAGATTSGRPYFVMEYCAGAPITDYCDRRKLSIRERLELFIQVCGAIQHAHQKGIIHRDIKPANILVDEVESKPLARIIDFGIAKATQRPLTDRTLVTEQHQLVGTPEYMSPEQAEGGLDIDTRTDVYSLGIVLYELLTSAAPLDSDRLRSAGLAGIHRIIHDTDLLRPSFKLRSRADLLAAAASNRSIPPDSLYGILRGELDWIVMKALEKDLALRYDSVGSMAADLQRYISGQAVQAVPPSTIYRVRKFVKRNRGPVIAAILLLFAVLAGLLGTSYGFINAERQRKLAIRQAYSANLMSASSALDTLQYGSARAFLDAAPESLRGWEWRTLHSALDTSVRSISTTGRREEVLDEFRWKLRAQPDGASFLAFDALSDTPVQQWSLVDGKLIRSFPRPKLGADPRNARSAMAVSADAGTLKLTAFHLLSAGACAEECWDLKTGVRSFQATIHHTRPVVFVAPTPSPSHLLIVRRQQTIQLEDPSGAEIQSAPFWIHAGDMAFSSDGELCAGVGPPNVVSILRSSTLEPVASLAGHTDQVLAAAFSQDGRWHGTAADDDTARIWDLSVRPPTSVILKHPRRVGNICFSPDASVVATICSDRAIRIWDRATGTLLATYASQSLIPHPLMFLPDGNTVAGQENDGTVRFWDKTAADARILRGHNFIVSYARSVPGNPAGLIISGGWDALEGSTASIRLWDAESGDPVGIHHIALEDVVTRGTIALSPDGRYAVMGFLNRNLRSQLADGSSNALPARYERLDLLTGATAVLGTDDRAPSQLLAFPDSRTIAIVTLDPASLADSRLDIRDLHSGKSLRTRDLGQGTFALAISPDGRSLLAAQTRSPVLLQANSHRIAVIDAVSLATTREIESIDEQIMDLSFSPDGTRFSTCGHDGVVRLYDFASGRRLASLTGHSDAVLDAAFSPDGTRLATAGLDRKIRIWDAIAFDQVAALGGHQGHIGDLDWNSGGERLLSCSGDSTVRIWDTKPIQESIRARDARRAALKIVEPMVASMFEQLRDPEKVAERIRTEASLDRVARRTALQVVLRTGLEKEVSARAPAAPPP